MNPDGDSNVMEQLFRYSDLASKIDFHIIPHGSNWSLEEYGKPQFDLKPNNSIECKCLCNDSIAIPAPNRTSILKYKVQKIKESKAYDNAIHHIKPKSGEHYPISKETLPPGVNPESLITVAHIIDEQVVGGITYQITKK